MESRCDIGSARTIDEYLVDVNGFWNDTYRDSDGDQGMLGRFVLWLSYSIQHVVSFILANVLKKQRLMTDGIMQVDESIKKVFGKNPRYYYIVAIGTEIEYRGRGR